MADGSSPSGPSEPTAELVEALYAELRELARSRMRGERPGATLRTTELVHEAYLRLGAPPHRGWANRAHFFASAAEAMRRILIERARARARENGRSASNRDVVHVTEGWTTREAHAENFASDEAKALTARITPLLGGEAQYQDEVPVGGKFAVGVASSKLP